MPYLTEDTLPSLVCCQVWLPDSEPSISVFSGAMLELTRPWNWEQYGDQSPEDTAELWRQAHDLTFPLVFCDAYWYKVSQLAPNNLLALWRINELIDSVAHDSSPNAFNGAISGVTLAAQTGPDGDNAPSFDGVNDYINVYSANFASAFNGGKGSALAWFKVSGAGVWTDGQQETIFRFLTLTNTDKIEIHLSSTSNTLVWWYRAGGVTKTVSKGSYSPTDWVCVGLTWGDSANGDAMKAYLNGTQEGTTQTGFGAWSGALYSAQSVIGSISNIGQSVMDGGIALVALWDTILSPAQMTELARL